ncbi:MAG TPA: TonB-dependent receptor, partial [Bryobacteraceae bacterium]
MRIRFPGLLACCSIFSACLSAADIQGKVVDPSGAPIPGAQISVVGLTGVEAQGRARLDGTFTLNAPENPEAKLVITAPGFRTLSQPIQLSITARLEIAPQVDSVQVVGSAIDVPIGEQGGSVSLIPNEEVRRRNEPFALDLLRYIPGMTFNQSGGAGGVTSLFLRGGNSNFNLVRIDGVPVNWFGGAFDFAHVPSEALESVEVARGPQSAVYGPYANAGAIDFVTRRPGSDPQLDLLAEGGTYHERRFAITGSGTLAGFGLLASASRYDNDGPVQNSDYRNEDVMLRLSRRFGRQRISAGGYFDSNESGEPGAWGSDPKHTFTGIDTISREKNNFSNYDVHYEADLTPRVRAEAFGGVFWDNIGFQSPFGFSYDNHVRGQGEARAIVSVSPHYTVAFGAAGGRERDTNTFITDDAFDVVPLARNDVAVYVENRFTAGSHFFLNAGVRGEFIGNPHVPRDRPGAATSSDSIRTANPKIAAAWVQSGTRLHASFGMGIRPPNGFELAFTDNPSLKPERTRSVDAGVEQKLLRDALLVDVTYFYNRFYDLIVNLGGSLSRLSHYRTDNLANSRAQGAEFSAKLRPARWVFVTGSYTLLKTRILSLDGASGQAPLPFTVGQPLTRRPENSGSVVSTFTAGRITADLTGYFRGKTLYEEPSLGATNGLFWNPGFGVVGINLNYRLTHG